MSMDEFKKDLEENKRSNGDRAERFKLRNGNNNIVILTNPIGFSTAFGLGIAYEGCGYAQYAGRKYKCYVLDLTDNQVKVADFSYTVAKSLSALSDGERTKFEGFPMPYSINLKSENAGTKEVKTDVLAMGDYTVSNDVAEQLSGFSPISEVLENLKKWQMKQNESLEAQEKIADFIAKKEKEKAEREAKKLKDKSMGENVVQVDPDYPQDEISSEDIPF